MAMFNLRRFSNPDVLKTIGREHLLGLLAPHKEYFSQRGVGLPPLHASNGIDYEGLAGVFMSPDADTPRDLANALYLVHEMATPKAMTGLIEEAEARGLQLDQGEDVSPADVAVQMWLKNKDVLERVHAQNQLTIYRSFEYFQTKASSVPELDEPSPEKLTALEQDLDEWFVAKKRCRGARVFVFPKEDGVWFLVRHGDSFRREGSFEDGRSSCIFYRPEKHDVLVYDSALGELRIHAGTKGEKELYRRKFGLHLFGDEEFFPGTGKYDLEPLRRDGEASLACTDVDGMEQVKLTEIRYFWGGQTKEIETRRATDIFASLYTWGRVMPHKPRIILAAFQIRFTDSKKPRKVTIRPSNVAQYTRDEDSELVEEWLTKRGFIQNGKGADNAEPCKILAFS